MPYPEPTVGDYLRIYRRLMVVIAWRYWQKAKTALRGLRDTLFYHTVKEGSMDVEGKCQICKGPIYLSRAGNWYHYQLGDLGHIAAPESPKSGQSEDTVTDTTRKGQSA